MNKTIEEIISQSTKTFDFESNSKFSKEGFESLKFEICDYLELIVNESFRLSQKNQSDLISKSNVEEAVNKLTTKRSTKVANTLSSVGAFLLGFSISEVLGKLSSTLPLTHIELIIILGTGILGALLVGIYNFGND